MSAKQSLEFLKGFVAVLSRGKSFNNVMSKFRFTDCGKGRCVGEFVVSKEDLNGFGIVHGGLISTIVDNCTSCALLTTPCHPGVSVGLQVNFLKGAMEGDAIVVDAKTVRTGRNIAYMECELRHKKDGSIVAKGSQTKFVNVPKNSDDPYYQYCSKFDAK